MTDNDSPMTDADHAQFRAIVASCRGTYENRRDTSDTAFSFGLGGSGRCSATPLTPPDMLLPVPDANLTIDRVTAALGLVPRIAFEFDWQWSAERQQWEVRRVIDEQPASNWVPV